MRASLFAIGTLVLLIKLLGAPLRADSQDPAATCFWLEVELNKNLLAVFKMTQDSPAVDTAFLDFDLSVKNTKSGRAVSLVEFGRRGCAVSELRKMGVQLDDHGMIRDSQVVRVPYRNQDRLEYADFNFDGQKDLCVEVGWIRRSGEDMRLFFADVRRDTVFSERDSLGEANSFELDKANKTLTAHRHGSDGYAQFSSFETYGRVKGKWRRIYETHARDWDHHPFGWSETRRLNHNSLVWKTQETWSWNEGWDGEVVKFRNSVKYRLSIAKRNREVVILEGPEDQLYYLLRDVGENAGEYNVELLFPYHPNDQGFELQRNKDRVVVSFVRGNVKYEVFQEASGGGGVSVERDGERKVWKAVLGTIQGDLDFSGALPTNVREIRPIGASGQARPRHPSR